ncbi:MAG: DUF4276 family protein [Ectothiorhodospiraceae bacterium]|nr:DUF4276 family protein [Ectothiorhodospiraceae bacterium]
MVRLAISVEGQTEEIFIQKLLVPYLQDRGIYAQPLLLGRHGGDVYLPRIKKDLNNLARSFDKVTTLYDFYGFKGKDQSENKATLEQKIVDCVAPSLREQIIPYVQMYEFEGLLFSSPEAIEDTIHQAGLEDWANGVLKKFNDNPEKINNSPQTAPSKILLDKSNYIKTVHGPEIARQIGLDVLREKCTGFDGWMSRLEALQE